MTDAAVSTPPAEPTDLTHPAPPSSASVGDALEAGLRERLDAIVCGILEVPAGSIAPELRFIEDLGADSLMFVEVLADVEDELGVVIAPAEMLRMTTLAGIYRVVAGLR